MKFYTFTPNGFEKLKKLLKEAEEEYKSILTEGYKSGAEQDGHHDEGFQKSLSNAMVQSKRIRELQELNNNAHIVYPENQNEVVKIGNGVSLEYGDGTIKILILEGYLMGDYDENVISIYSPLGKAILGSKRGDEKTITLPKSRIKVKITDIILPAA